MTYTYLGGPWQGESMPTPIAIGDQSTGALPCPSEMKESIEDLHGESQRNAAGYLVSDIIRANVVKLELSWKVLSRADYAALKTRLGGSMFKTVYYYGSGGLTTKTMYKSALSAAPYRFLHSASPVVNEIEFYTDITLSLIER